MTRYFLPPSTLGHAFPKLRRVKRSTRWKSTRINADGTLAEPEESLQKRCELYLDACGLRYLHIPSSVGRACSMGSRISIGQKVEIADYLKGVPDLLIFSGRGAGPFVQALLVELKAGRNKFSAGQRRWADNTTVNECRDFDAFKVLVDVFRGHRPLFLTSDEKQAIL